MDKIDYSARLAAVAFFLIVMLPACSSISESTDTQAQIRSEGCQSQDYSPPQSSPYILPYEYGERFIVSQGNCGGHTHQAECRIGTIPCGDLRYAYDFDMQIGTTVIAARSGTVTLVEDGHRDSTNIAEQNNVISIRHDDGSHALYYHLTKNGALVSSGDSVRQGQPIAKSGASGYLGESGVPHLHFHVIEGANSKCNNEDYSGCTTIPVTFSNALPLDAPLKAAHGYKALPVTRISGQ